MICECESVLVLGEENSVTLRDIDQVSEAGRLDRNQEPGQESGQLSIV